MLKLILFYSLINLLNGQDCDFGPSIIGQLPVLPRKFQVNVEINILNENRTASQRWYFDGANRQAAVDIRENDQISKLIFNYETDEVYQIIAQTTKPDTLIQPPDGKPLYPSFCITKILSTFEPNEFVNFGFYKRNSTYFLPFQDSNQIFKFQAQNYNGTTIVNGINCDVYLSCQSESDRNYSTTYYFSRKDHNMPTSDPVYNRLPVRAIFKGTKRISNGNYKPYEYWYEFHNFRTDITNSQVFNTPSTVFCKDRKMTKPLPKLRDRFSYSEEIVTAHNQVSYLTNIHYAYKYNLLRYDSKNSIKSEASFYSTDPITFVSDYTVGVQYGINQVIGNCSIRGIRSGDFGEDYEFTNNYNQSGLGFAIRLKSPENFLDLDSDYVYTGTNYVNSINSDRYISTKSQFGVDFFYEYAFSTPDFTILNGVNQEHSIPVSLDLNIPESNFESRTNFFNFDSVDPSLKLFDLSQCYKSNEIIQLKMAIPYKHNSSRRELEAQEDIEDKILNMLYNATQEPAIRFSRPITSISHKEDILYIIVKLFPRPPPLTMFAYFESKFLPITPIMSLSVNSVEQCAIACIERTSCLSFDFSRSKNCYLNDRHISDNFTNPISDSVYFDHYSRNTVNATIVRESYKLFYLLTTQVDKKQLILEIDDKTPCDLSLNKKKQLFVSSVEQINSTLNRFGTTSLLSNYKIKLANSRLNKQIDASFSQISIDDCAKLCNEQMGFECKSFDFCYINGDCSLSRNLAPNKDDSIGSTSDDYVKSENCDIYEKDALFHYVQFAGKALINKNDQKIESINTPSECASKCDNTKDLQCRSFNYCPNSKFCYLSDKHLVDGSVAANSNDLLCDHYSKKYLLDFIYVTTENIVLDAEVVLTDSSLELCSTECVVMAGFTCKSFDYCPETKSCLLNSGPKQIRENTAQSKRDDCGHYRRDYFYLTSLNANLNQEDSSSTTMTTLSVIFSIISTICGFGLIFYFGRNHL